MEVEWAEPFTWEDFPIINYFVQVLNQTSNETLASEVLSSSISSYNITRKESSSCSNIVFIVQAISAIGSSTSGVISGGFPAGIYFSVWYVIFVSIMFVHSSKNI